MAGIQEMLHGFLIGSIALLDALPDSIRALLSGLVLAAFLRFFESRISSSEWQLGQSFRKTALVALLLIPLLVWLFPASRMVVFVEELPNADGGAGWLWRLVIGCWAVGAAGSLFCLGRAHFRALPARVALPVLRDEQLTARLRHWQRRLGLEPPVTLIQAPDGPRLGSNRLLAVPADICHWPVAVRDVMLIQGLCHIKRGHIHWHVVAAVVACMYWPVTWVQSLGTHLWRDLEQATATLARSCFSDRIGYARAIRQLESRLGARQGKASDRPAARSWLSSTLNAYASGLVGLARVDAVPVWPAAGPLDADTAQPGVVWTDPYDRVVLFTLQAAFFAFLLTGVTLRERPPELDVDYQLPFELLWKENLHRNRELLEKFGG